MANGRPAFARVPPAGAPPSPAAWGAPPAGRGPFRAGGKRGGGAAKGQGERISAKARQCCENRCARNGYQAAECFFLSCMLTLHASKALRQQQQTQSCKKSAMGPTSGALHVRLPKRVSVVYQKAHITLMMPLCKS